MKIGILALQGAVQPHAEKLIALGVQVIEVRFTRDLIDLKGIILPGGESSSMIHLLKLNQLWEPLKEYVRTRPTWGVCAGSILLAKTVTHPIQASLEAMDIEVERNAYGRQNESFIGSLTPSMHWKADQPFEGVFIRAPRIKRVNIDVQVIFEFKGEPVMVRQKHLLASTFHPELTDSTQVHEFFLDTILIPEFSCN